MTEQEKYVLFTQVKDYLLKQGYYVGNSEVAKILREVADYAEEWWDN